MTQVYVLKLDGELTEDRYHVLLNKIDEKKQNRIKSFDRREDSLRSLFADLLVRYIVTRDFGLKNEHIHFGYSEHEKPFVKARDNFHFNVAHSGEWVVCVTGTTPVGIDVERIRPIDLQVARQCFSAEECGNLFMQRSSEQLNYFYELWTLKESYMKLSGAGFSIAPESFTVLIDENKKAILKHGTEADIKVVFTQYSISENYKMAICSTKHAPNEIVPVSMQEIVEAF